MDLVIKMLPPNYVVRRKLSPKEETVRSILEVSLFRLHAHNIVGSAFPLIQNVTVN
jgi:hypothetical protein